MFVQVMRAQFFARIKLFVRTHGALSRGPVHFECRRCRPSSQNDFRHFNNVFVSVDGACFRPEPEHNLYSVIKHVGHQFRRVSTHVRARLLIAEQALSSLSRRVHLC